MEKFITGDGDQMMNEVYAYISSKYQMEKEKEEEITFQAIGSTAKLSVTS